MKRLVWLMVLGMQLSFAQNVVKHKVAKGETVAQIAKKYDIAPKDIYRLNPDALKGVPENTVLVIALPGKSTVEPKKKEAKKADKKSEEPSVIVKHEVQPKETLYSLSKQYGTTVEEIEKSNPEIKDGLSVGQVLSIPSKKGSFKQQEPKKKEAKKQEPVYHVVQTKETKYGIAKQYGITVEELEKKNPEIDSGLQIGQNLLIKGERPKVEAPKVDTPKAEQPVVAKPQGQGIMVVEKALTTIGYTVQPKETLYSLARQFNITQEDLIKMNPELKDGVKEGMLIEVPVKPELKTVVKKELSDLSETIQIGSKKKLALLLPFNIAKLDQDTINSTKSRLKKDKFLNMTLDFYAGALTAIDSAKVLGLNVDVAIFDSDETKSTSNVTNLIQDNNLKNYNAVIGPFYQNNVEKAASLLGNVPIISPLSKDYDKKFPNLIQATTMPDDVKQAMFDFMRQKSGNIIAVVDPKKASVKQYIETNHKDVRFAAFNAQGGLDVAQMKSLFVKDKMNYVVMETEKTNLILSTTSALMASLKDFQINLVILGENDALDFEEIQMNRLTKLKLHYPSASRPNKSDAAENFEENFKKKNRVFPNQFATRGFDVTFDILLRLSQDKPIMDTFNELATEQVESEFNYVQNPDGGYMNKGVHILFYDTDLTIKEAK